MTYAENVNTAFAMWRKTYEDFKRYYTLGYMEEKSFRAHLQGLGFRSYEIDAEIDLLGSVPAVKETGE